MTDQVDIKSEGTEGAAQTPEGIQVAIQRIYTKDISFEAPNVPEIFQDPDFKPEVKMELNSRSRKLSDDVFEVVLSVTMTAAQGEKTGFLVEVQQAGIFGLKGLNDAQLHRILSTYCPETLFPYSRETISNLVTKGGFPPMYLTPVNFDLLYQQQLEQAQQQAQQQAGGAENAAAE
ncbi:protein-export chaperone SecB [Pleionea litopenaei]|uniref:Protein-export protein SecB n=1 Tax=Pleionea litopenaei TaxID=3070815 RepID=A0AA51RQN9_9GAMM|nr:protein-export chaperone SecB [Pleionea sp. HL-JVS1]WMS85775.1 protein-export chaperone SecB [Pleionea sp. HL-JVS1]